MSFKLHNCAVCKEILTPNDETLCNPCLMKSIREMRPSFFVAKAVDYPEHIRANYVQDPVTKVWTKKHSATVVK
jgi:hypothetical protein